MGDEDLRRQRVLRLHSRLLEASEQFPTFNHFAMRSDDPLCWSALAAEPIDSVPDIPRSPHTPNCHLRAQWDQHFEKRYATQADERHARSSLEFRTHLWLWESVLFTKYGYGTGCVKSPVQRLTVAANIWNGLFTDPTEHGINLPGHHQLMKFGSEILSEVCEDALSSKASQIIEWSVRDRLLVETLYREFPQQPTQHGPIEIIALPWNVFLTAARLLERRMSSPFSNPRSFSPSELCAKLDGMSPERLHAYAKMAEVETPSVGDREHRYSNRDAIKICETILRSSATGRFKDAARELLQELSDNAAA